jgi:hypothetical protein
VPENAQGELQGGISAITNMAMLAGTVVFPQIFGHFMAEGRDWRSPSWPSGSRRFAFWCDAGDVCRADRREEHQHETEVFTGSFTQQEPIPEEASPRRWR